MSEFLKLTDWRVRRGKRLALTVESLQLEAGGVLAVAGPNGAGKSTLLMALARLIPLERGEIWLNGRPACAESALRYRRRLGLVMQSPLLFDTSVYENVACGLRFRGLPEKEIRSRVEKWLERLKIFPLAKRRAAELSGGEGQRVSLARALALEPELLLLDEPFSALDAPTRAHLLDDLRRLLAETGTTTLFVTHDLEEARQIATRLAIILGGRLAQVDAPEQIFSQPVSQEVRAFLGI
ncbi:MAG: ABC transporter [Anaerolineae bacterium CG_4_9_14_3_um_filter_57_17]|nr:ABC transporter ATP-binding protein [bacterium]NCT21088.1 ABC transporter ATP-binding protein [bacterium]OIO87442.1 MAG: hypothetical protein AUK01_00015 [Anaerolineae bacterium CG2_30_57_67]PJB66408.1 MAG: ABC transporter [Anaerolineae bacterium CG_4_9_14_3_um_filter_57_17]